MNRKRASFLLALALGLPLCAFGVDPGEWLTPACTADNPYSFDTYEEGDTFSFPTAAYQEWRVFNASSEAAEGEKTYTIATKDNEKYLAFNGGGALAQDSSAYLALEIRDADGNPLVMSPETGAKMRTDNVYAKVLFVPTSDTPDPETLKEMYPTYADSKLAGTTQVTPYAAKLGVFVNESGHFCVSRVRFSSNEDAGDSGTAEDYVYEFVQTDHTLEDLGGGAVIIRIEFQTYTDATGSQNYTRMFRIFAQDAAKTKAEVCLTSGLGCQWSTKEEAGTGGIVYTYKYDFSVAGDCLPAWDTAVVLENDENITLSSLAEIDELNLLGFSATSGGFYSAWLASNANVTSADVLQTYASTMSLAGFEPYVTDPNSSAFSIYTDWATRYNVNLESYLGQLPGTQTMSLMSTADDKDIEYVYNAFLLDMDPAVDVTQSLTVTGLSPDTDQVAITVCGPTGAQLANLKAAKLCVKRAETPDGLTADDVYTVYPSFTSDTQGNIIFVLPTTVNGRTLPFMKVTLDPLYPAD